MTHSVEGSALDLALHQSILHNAPERICGKYALRMSLDVPDP